MFVFVFRLLLTSMLFPVLCIHIIWFGLDHGCNITILYCFFDIMSLCNLLAVVVVFTFLFQARVISDMLRLLSLLFDLVLLREIFAYYCSLLLLLLLLSLLSLPSLLLFLSTLLLLSLLLIAVLVVAVVDLADVVVAVVAVLVVLFVVVAFVALVVAVVFVAVVFVVVVILLSLQLLLLLS